MGRMVEKAVQRCDGIASTAVPTPGVRLGSSLPDVRCVEMRRRSPVSRAITIVVGLLILTWSTCAVAGRLDVLVLEPDVKGPAFFPKERARLAKGAIGFLTTKKDLQASIVSPAKVARLRKQTRSAGACPAPPSFQSLAVDKFGNAMHALVGGACHSGGCWLTLKIILPATRERAATTVARWSAKVADPADIGSWEKAFDALRVGSPPSETSDPLAAARGGAKRGVRIARVETTGSWSPAPKIEDIGAVQAGLDACYVADRVEPLEDQAVLEADLNGAVSRCHVFLGDDPAETKRGTCLCGALKKLKFSKAKAQRRLDIALLHSADGDVLQGGQRIRARLTQIENADGFGIEGPLSTRMKAIAQCFGGKAVAGNPVSLTLEIGVGKNGKVGRVKVSETGSPAMASCIKKAVRSAALPCPFSGKGAMVEAKIAISAEPLPE